MIYDRGHVYSYIGNVKSIEDMIIETENPNEDGAVVVFRDSFGNALLSYVADELGYGLFTRGVPFDVGLIDQYEADTLHIP